MGDPSTVPIHPGEGFWINPFGVENLGGFRPESYGQPSAPIWYYSSALLPAAH